MFLHRPRPGEDEDDLLEFQAKFLASGEKSSVKVISSHRAHETRTQKQIDKDVVHLEPEETFNLHSPQVTKNLKKCERKFPAKQRPVSHKDVEAEMDHYDTHITAVLGDVIKEREISCFPTFPGLVNVANPQATRRSWLKTFQKNSLKSIFAVQYEEEKNACLNEDAGKLIKNPPQKFKPVQTITNSRTASGVGGRDLLHEVHKENVDKLSGMSVEDIIKEQELLKARLDSKTVAFIKQRRDILIAGNKSSAEREFISKPQDRRSSPQHDPSHISVDGTWMNMENVEAEKMKWMEEIHDTSRNKEVELPNRFGFEGNLLSWEESSRILSHVGLHHHDDEPDLAGYKLQELVSLSRSSFLQQRVFALKLLARIIDKDKQGYYCHILPESVLPPLMGAGVAFIFRWALDEHSESGIQAAVDAIFSLLMPMSIQVSLRDEILLSHRGYEFSSLHPESTIVAKETKEESDFELISRDLVLGYVRMDTLSRIRYILEICQPEASVVHKCLGILIRISQHSTSVAVRVLDTPRLIKHIVTQYLPHGFPGNSKAATSDRHSAEAMRLLRTICMSGRHAAARLVDDHKEIRISIISVMAGYSSLERQEIDVGASELEAWRLWTVCVSYGIGINWFRDSTPVLMECFQTCIQLIGRPCCSKSMIWIQHVVSFLTSVLTNLSKPCGDSYKALHVELAEVKGFYPLLTTLLNQTVQASLDSKGIQEDLFGIVSCTLDAVATFHSKGANLFNVPGAVVDVVATMQPLQAQVLNFQDALMSSSSCSLSSLPSLPQLCVGRSSEDELSIIRKQRYIAAFLRCSVVMVRADRKLCAHYTVFLEDWCARDTLGHLITSQLSSSTRLVCHSIYWLVKLFVITSLEHTSLQPLTSYFHSLSLSCLSFLPPGEECWAHDLLCNVIFHPNMMRDINDVAQEELPRLCTVYVSCGGFTPQNLHKSLHWTEQNPQEITSFFLPPNDGPLLPRDWPFFPIVSLYDTTIHREETSNQAPTNFILQQIKSSLTFLLLLEKYRSDFWMRVPNTLKVTRLMCLFLAGSDIFLDGTVKSLLNELFQMYCRSNINFKQEAEGIVSFYDFYMALLDQYEAVSYGDSLFSSVLLLPLTQPGDKQYKMALWAEHGDAMRYIGISESKILLPEELYLNPVESDYEVIRAYLSALVTGRCARHCSPFLHKVALHHIVEYYKVYADEGKRREIFSTMHRIAGLHDVLPDPDHLSMQT